MKVNEPGCRRWARFRIGVGGLTLAVMLLGIGAPAHAQVDNTGLEGAQSETARLVKSYPFRGSTFGWYQSLNAFALDRGADLTYNPSFTWLFRFWPRYHLTDKLSLRLKLDLGVELTDSDFNTRKRDAMMGETWLDLVYGAIREPWSGINFVPSMRLLIPTSKISRARSRILGFGPGFALARSFKLPAKMGLNLAMSFRYIKNLNRYTTVQYDAPLIATCPAGAGNCDQFLHTGERNPSHEFQTLLSLGWSITSKLQFTLMVAFFNQLVYDLTPATVNLAGGTPLTVADVAQDVGHRASVWYYGELSYQVHPTISLALAFSTFNPQLADDSTYRTPFFNRFTEVMFSTVISLDHIVALFDRRRGK